MDTNLKVRPLKINFLILRFINTNKSKTNFSLCNKIDFSLIFREIVRKYTFFFSGLAFVENINIRCIFAWKSRLLLDIEVIFVCNFTTFLWGGSSRCFFFLSRIQSVDVRNILRLTLKLKQGLHVVHAMVKFL